MDTPKKYVITCGDEGVQINEGTRLGVVGAGFRLKGFSEIVSALKKLLGDDLSIAAHEESDWIKEQLELSNWEQVNASAQQHVQASADLEKLTYAGFLPFADPRQLVEGIKGHMVRPRGIHIANKICFTLAGGEQTYNLGCYVISAEWVSSLKPQLAEEIIKTQVDFYTKLNRGEKLKIGFEEAGELGEKVAAKNRAVLEKFGYIAG
ncbi:MAG TPA: hypothetical protein VD999_02140 [Vitreimonas sp.]|nr:hypothetical protein [Vitreimonas sp.]